MTSTALRSLWAEPRAVDVPARPWVDRALVAVMLTATLLEGALRDDVTWRLVSTVATLALAPLIWWRRSRPLICVVLAFGSGTALGVASELAGVTTAGLNTAVFVLVFAYALVRWASGRHILIGSAVIAVAALSSIVTDETRPAEWFGGLAVLVAAMSGGAAMRYRAESWRRALDQARSQERVGLARELHDSVAHHVSAITVQAQAGRALAAQRPQAALDALEVIEAEASRTLAEMRAMVRVLRDGVPAQYAPQAGVRELLALGRRSGPPVVEVVLSGDLSGLPPTVDAAAYRIAQEALTNALRHAVHATRVEIRVFQQDSRLRVTVTDDGQIEPSRPGSPHPASLGFGVLGMTERAHLLGGTLRAGPDPTGGWVVDAVLPLEVTG